MSVSTNIVAQVRVSKEDMELVNLFNMLIKHAMWPSDELINKLYARLPKTLVAQAVDNEYFGIAEDDVIEISMYGTLEGNPDYGGAVLSLDDLPAGTFAIRVYRE